MKVLEIILEMSAESADNLKQVLANKITTLPIDDQSIKTLREIEDLLRDVNAGGFKGLIKKDLQSIDDPAVTANQKTLAMYINSIEGDPEQRKELFDMWRGDKIVNKDVLFSGDDVGFDEIFNGYTSNPFITELVNTLMTVNATGHGKGEFALSVFSKDINKPVGNKGDLIAHYNNKLLHVEVKAADRTTTIEPETGKEKTSDSSARFSDQDVGTSDAWMELAKDLNNYVQARGEYTKRTGPKEQLPKTGMNIGRAIKFYINSEPKEKTVFLQKVENVVKAIFGREGKIERPKYIKSLENNIQGILAGIQAGNYNATKQAYVNATFNYYMAKKKDDGVLFVNIIEKTMVWYDSAEALTAKGLRLSADSIYLTGTNDPNRSAYPQVYVVPTTFGGDAANQNLKKFAGAKDPFSDRNFAQKLSDWVTKLAQDRNITDPTTINTIHDYSSILIANRTPLKAILPELEKQIPQLQMPVARTVARVKAQSEKAAQLALQQDQAAQATAQAAQAANTAPATPAPATA
jgi:hypothetical protein